MVRDTGRPCAFRHLALETNRKEVNASFFLCIFSLCAILFCMDAQVRAKVEELAQKVRWAADRL